MEHEAKFLLKDCRSLEPVLAIRGRLRHPWHFEANTVYDRAGELRGSGRLLRLRHGIGHILTFKEPAVSRDGIKSRVETECSLDRPENMARILTGLGYSPTLRYEKFRSVWALDHGLVFLDILPFGHCVEIEADPDLIPVLAADIGLDPAAALSANYHELHCAWRQEHGLPPSDDFVFTDEERNRLTTRLGCTAR